ncbi:hypothetical protein [Listeria ivanovii]|uniref:hypothetical protein n=1 Tax=Listeria ivanovii TaxID=1638 RepID=UPI00162351E4|nr:hypothetical protein [Listeria ivanovii]MBC2254388.1 hypothetical protein [Listeria ivanovii]MBM5609146.1 hypothetical protein [Listeria ivanovii]MBM5637643.1 hypothetical protein [Listeria ivanovii]MBM5707016.1 hypothetical protein [Listeria ivanovii]
MIYKRIGIAIIAVSLSLVFITACSQNEVTKGKTPVPKEVITIDDMQAKVDIDNIILTKFTKEMTDTKGKFAVVLAMKDTVYDQFETITEPYYYTLLLPVSMEEMVTSGVKSVPANQVKKLTKEEAAKKGIKVDSEEFAGEDMTFLSVEQVIEWDDNSKTKPSLEGKFDFAIQNEDLVNAFYFSDVQLFVNGFNEVGEY